MRRSASILLAWALVICVPCADAQDSPYFVGIRDLPGGIVYSRSESVSADGRSVVGDSTRGGFGSHEAIRWSLSDGIDPLGSETSNALDVCGRGRVITGAYVIPNDSVEAFRWTHDSGMVGMGDLPGGEFRSSARGISVDGRIVVGYGSSSDGAEAFRWAPETGMVGLGDLEGGAFGSSAARLSADGRVIVGTGKSQQGTEAFRWTAETGMVGLGDLEGGSFYSVARSVSADGAVIVGSSMASGGEQSFRWTREAGMVGLGRMPGGDTTNRAHAVSWDGDVIGGESIPLLIYETAFIWTPDRGMQPASEYLAEHGVVVPDGWFLESVTGVSADGRTIVGFGVNPSFHGEGWVAYLGPACRADFNKDGAVTTQDFFDYLNAWADRSIFTDWNYDGVINTIDFLAFLNDYAKGCP